MVSYAQLEAEQWWGREIVTTELDWLGDQLCAALGRPRSAFGTKGNNLHLDGGHRSQEWILRSIYCENRVYTVQSGLSADQLRHISAGDFTPGVWGTAANRALVVQQTTRLWDDAVAGNLPGVVELEGSLDGRSTAGINLITGSVFRPSSSHLDHWHARLDRRRLRDADLMARILETVLTGGDDMTPKQDQEFDDMIWRVDALWANTNLRGGRFVNDPVLSKNMLKAAIEVPASVTLTPEQLEQLAQRLAALMPVPATPEQIADEVVDELDERLDQ